MDQTKVKKSGGFESMGLIPELYRAIKNQGFNVPTPIQRKAIPQILAGRDIVACSKTGSGKTAAFLIPLINKLQNHSTVVGIRGLILLPTRELALQIASVLKVLCKFTDLQYSIMVGGHGFEGQFESLASNPDILICTPGRVLQHLLEDRLKLSRVQMVIYDEADYLFEMGLADQLKQILIHLPSQKQSLMFSATIPEQLSMFASVGLKDYIFCKLDKEFQLPDTMQLHFLLAANDNKLSALIYLIRQLEDTCLVFASTRFLVDMLSYALNKFHISSVHVYGKMDQLDRKEQLDNFKRNQAKVLIVTDLASRGIDLPFVANVIHYDYPSNPKIFIHRSGRTARAGKAGYVYALISSDEILYIKETMIYVGRKLVNEGDINDPSLAFYGSLPIELLMQNQEKLNDLNDDIEFQNYKDIAIRANEKFRKTRGSAKKVKTNIDTSLVHPLFKDKIQVEEDTKDMLNQIKNFKSTQSVIEIKKFEQNSKSDPFMKAVSHLKDVQKRKPIPKIELKEQPKSLNIENFMDQKFFIPTQRDPTKKSEFEDLHKITVEDINPFVISDETDALRKKKQMVWDKEKKKYVNPKATQQQDKEDRGMKVEKGKQNFKKWQKQTSIQLQNVGEEEDQQIVSRAKEMFKRRQMRSKGYYFNQEEGQQRGGKQEIKRPEQLLKSKKIKKNLKLKNMEKGKRRQIEKKQRKNKL
ncbi:unnamed protein product [Paramecium pentaurelia]|uniref:RNA helicase n=1 Tax=Paramecium pentaurelia TaxID=43138 RepID=A0A8S1WHA4_9CILI|nr:unnamed protein product [Paramecium pentaurelia]